MYVSGAGQKYFGLKGLKFVFVYAPESSTRKNQQQQRNVQNFLPIHIYSALSLPKCHWPVRDHNQYLGMKLYVSLTIKLIRSICVF